MVTPPRWLRAISLAAATTLIASALMVVSGATAQADVAPTSSTPSTVASSPLPTVQVDGVVWAQVVIGNTVYVGGNFTTAQPAGAAAGVGGVARANMLAYNLQTGALISSFAPGFNSQVRGLAASPDGSRLYAVGSFTKVNGVVHDRLVALNPTSGSVVPAFSPDLNGQALSVAVSSTTVYVGGQFTSADGVARGRAAAVRVSDGSLLPWAPSVPDHSVRALLVSPDSSKVVLGGDFLSVNGSSAPGYGMAAVDAINGTNLPWTVGQTVQDAGDKAAIFSLSSDGTNVYGTGFVAAPGGNLEGVFNASWADGSINWIEDCHGDTYGATAMNGVVYEVGHSHECQTVDSFPQTDPDWHFQRSLAYTVAATGTLGHNQYGGYADWAGQPAPTQLAWYPDIASGTFTGQSQGAWSATSAKGYLLLGGEFPTVNGQRQTGLARFATTAIAADTDGPRLTGTPFKPNVRSNAAGTATVSWRANYDRDDQTLKYDVFRNGDTTTPIYSTSAQSRDWFDRPVLSYTDRNLTPGASYSYQLKATDAAGNVSWGYSAAVTIASPKTALGAYDAAVLSDGAQNYWRLSDAAGATTAADTAGPDNLAVQTGVTFGGAGASQSGTSATFSGDSSGFASGQTIQRAPQTFSVEAWFKTTSTSGGRIVGFGSNNGTIDPTKSITSSNYDRQIYMDGSGRVSFGVWNGSGNVISSPSALNDGRWHHVVGTLGAGTQQFFVDGVRAGSLSNVVNAQDYYGYWRIGGDSTWAGSQWFSGAVADVAVYPAALSSTTVRSHWGLAGNVVAAAPKDAYGAAVFADAPDRYWRLDEPSGATSAADASGNGDIGAYSGGVNLGDPGALAGSTGSAATFDGTTGALASGQQMAGPTTYSAELWFKTTTDQGGKLIGFGNAQTGISSSYDRQVWMSRSGHLSFGTYTGQLNVVTTDGTFNDGAWHHVVATQGSDGMNLYVDGGLVGSNPQSQAQPYDGYWRVGGDNLDGWDDASRYFAGTIDEVAVYGTELSADRIRAHHDFGVGNQNVPPTAAFTSTAKNLTASFDAAGSTDTDGAVKTYAWVFGDGSTGDGVSPSHTYGAAGTYTVKLTVTDDGGASASASNKVTVTAPNAAPVASFTTSTSNLTASLDASASADADGTVKAYAWDFGDGSTGSGVTTSHDFAVAGTYAVKLTVTDDGGAIGTATKQVTVSAPAAQHLAADKFERIVTSGLGAADVGGNWTVDGTPSNYSVGSGAATLRTSKGTTLSGYLNSVSTADVNLSASFTVPALPVGANSWAGLVVRRTATDDYSGIFTITPTGAVSVQLLHGKTSLKSATVTGLKLSAGSIVHLRVQASGSAPTTLQARAWLGSGPEPATWQVSASDTTTALQASGGIGLRTYLGSGATNGPVGFAVDDLVADQP